MGKVDWAILFSKMARRLEPNLLRWDVSLCVPVCLHLVIEVILNRIVSPIFGVVLIKILWRTMRMMLKKAPTHKLTSRVVSCDVLTARFKWHFWGKNSSTLRARKINSFYRRNPKFWIVYFKRYIFILCGKNFRFIGTLRSIPDMYEGHHDSFVSPPWLCSKASWRNFGVGNIGPSKEQVKVLDEDIG